MSSTRQFTDEATTEYALAVARYADKLHSLAIGKSSAEMVLVEHVRAAIEDLGPSTALRAVVDWIKRVAFLFVGFSVVQGINVLNQADIQKGSVVWLVVDIVVASVLVGIALCADAALFKRALARVRLRSKRTD